MTPQLYLFIQQFRRFIGKHHAVLFTTLLCLLLGIAVLSLEQVLAASNDPTSDATPSTIDTFDQSTIDKIKQLHNSSDLSAPLTFPTPRANPFAE